MHLLKLKQWALSIALTFVYITVVYSLVTTPSGISFGNNRTLPYKQPQVQDQSAHQNSSTSSNNTSNSTPTVNHILAAGVTKLNQHIPTLNCSSVCSPDELSNVLQRLIQDDGTLHQLREASRTTSINGSSTQSSLIRPECIQQLLDLIRGLASNELEMKTMLDFASDINLHHNRGHLFRSKFDSNSTRTNSSKSTVEGSKTGISFSQLRAMQSNSFVANRPCSEDVAKDGSRNQVTNTPADDSIQEGLEKSRVLTKFIAGVDHWINSLERFTLTKEWVSLLKVFKGSESIVGMFVSQTSPIPVKDKSMASISSKTAIAPKNETGLRVNESATAAANASDLVENLTRNLPAQVLALTTSMNNLFPWHVWPWNNLDLYTTIDTFLNHGIFAFSKTTTGPDRRIDLLPEMLKTLFNSLKYDNFPKKCNDWSKIICDRDSFHDRLVIPPALDESVALPKEREEKAKDLSSVPKNQLTQELTCIMFSSLSMQHFGAGEAARSDQNGKSDQLGPSAYTKLPWDKQVEKALKLYTLSREALTDEQWMSLYDLLRDLWSQQKVSDRVIMVSRVIQLLSSCHMPKELLESALWKDIYKYKNALNQLLDIVIEELNRSSENGQLTIQQIALGSINLQEILRRFIKILPNLIESLSHTIVDDMPELVGRFFNEKATFFKIPCKGNSFSDIITSLSSVREEILKLESMVCQQIHTKPNITMMQINNLVNEFLAMAFNFSSFGNALALPKLLTNLDTTGAVQEKSLHSKSFSMQEESDGKQNVTSIIDELASNPRLNKIVAILQSSPLDPPEVHAELPELDWVEAGTSVALLYESIQRLLSYEGGFTIFPEVPDFQVEIKSHVDSSQHLFKKFSKRDPIRLVAYSLDTVMPVALRTFKPMDSFHTECISSFRDIFSEDVEGKSTRQWQCLVSSMNFASWALNNFMKTFNNMFKNILEQMTKEALIRNKRLMSDEQKAANTCIFFDGSVSMMLDNLPQFIDLALETVLMASTNSDQQLTLYDIMCSSNYMLDPFNELSIELKARMKDKMCHLFHKNSLANCADVLHLDQWTSTMRDLNNTWFESSAISIKPSFRDITLNAHEFLELFGQFKPSTMSDSLIGRVLNVNSFWMNLLNRTMSIIDKYQEKRFEYALQTLTPIIYDNLPTSTKAGDVVDVNVKEVRETLITTILGAKAILNYLDKQSTTLSSSSTINLNNQFEKQIQTLFNWTDQYSLISAEILLKTLANNITKLEDIFRVNVTGFGDGMSRLNSTAFDRSKITLGETWRRFCSSPLDRYLYFDVNPVIVESNSTSKPQNLQSTYEPIFGQMSEGKEFICTFEWKVFYDQLSADSNKSLSEYPEKQLTRIALTKLGQVLDMMFIESKHIKQLPKFFYMDYWQSFRVKLPQISPLKDQPSNLVWIWKGFERVVNAMDAGTNQTSKSLLRILDQLNCGLDAVKGGLSWENIGNIYQDKQDILAAHSTINNGFAIASIGVNTFLAHKKFQRFLDEFIKPRVGLNAFCELRDRTRLQSIFSIPEGQDFLEALESFQELICDTNFETLAQNINPISVCYQTSTFNQQVMNGTNKIMSAHPLADIMDRFFKLASLAILDAKLVVASDAKPPILDKDQWQTFWNWWSDKAEPQPKSSLALTIVRAFQTLDSINSNHVVWKALFRSINEISEVVAYLLKAVEKKHNEVDMMGTASRLSLVKEAAAQIDTAIRSNGGGGVSQQQQLASTLSNIIFPEVNNFISFRTFKQLRYIKSISDYFTVTKGAQDSFCGNSSLVTDKSEISKHKSRFELIGYKLNTNERLFSLLCHYHSSHWLTALNIVISTRTTSIPKKINYMTKYLSIFTRSYKDTESLEAFIHSQQLENIENVANTTVSYVVAASHSFKSLSISKISNVSWHSLPNLLDSIDRHVCSTKYEKGTFLIPKYEPKKPELETLVCRMPQWNVTQVYSYLSENFDLQNMISLITQQNGTKSITEGSPANQTKTCVTPFKFASRWLKIGQETVDDMMSKSSRDKLRKCLSLSKKGHSIYSQALRYIKVINSLLGSINDLTINESWPVVKRTWNSISYIILDQGSSYTSRIY